MATTNLFKNPCCKCDKSGMSTCNGCHRAFCRTHMSEHHQELSVQMDDICREYNVFQRNFNETVNEHPLLSRVDRWEQESHRKIEEVAKQARIELKELIERSRKDLEASWKQINDELQSSQHSEDYTEFDFEVWTDRLNELRNELERPLTMDVINDDDKESIIRLIKVSGSLNEVDKNLTKPKEITTEKFDQMTQKSLLSEDRLLATCLDQGPSVIYGIQSYSSGIRSIRFRIEQISKPNMFFGITTNHQMNSAPSYSAPSTNGWWNLAKFIKAGISEQNDTTISIQTGDEVALALDCDLRQINFCHRRTGNILTISVDLEKCPFPWKIFIVLMAKDDCVRLLGSENS